MSSFMYLKVLSSDPKLYTLKGENHTMDNLHPLATAFQYSHLYSYAHFFIFSPFKVYVTVKGNFPGGIWCQIDVVLASM